MLQHQILYGVMIHDNVSLYFKNIKCLTTIYLSNTAAAATAIVVVIVYCCCCSCCCYCTTFEPIKPSNPTQPAE